MHIWFLYYKLWKLVSSYIIYSKWIIFFPFSPIVTSAWNCILCMRILINIQKGCSLQASFKTFIIKIFLAIFYRRRFPERKQALIYCHHLSLLNFLYFWSERKCKSNLRHSVVKCCQSSVLHKSAPCTLRALGNGYCISEVWGDPCVPMLLV